MESSQSSPDNNMQNSFWNTVYAWKRTIGILAVIGAVLGVSFMIYTLQTAQESARVQTNMREAKQIANAELKKRDLNPQEFTQSIVFQPRLEFSQTEGYIAQFGTNQDFDSALQTTGWSGTGWTVSYSKDGKERAVKVRITPQGSVSNVNQIYPDDAKGASLTESQARDDVRTYLQEERGIKLEHIEEQSVEQTDRPNRTDYTFTYHFTSDVWKVNEANLAFKIDVEGESVNGFSPQLDIPDEWRRTEASPNGGEFAAFGLAFLLGLVTLGVMVWGFVYALRERVFMFNAGKWGAYTYIGIAILATLNTLPRFFFPYGAGGISLNNFLAITIGGKVIQIAFMAFIAFLAIALGIGAWKAFVSSRWGLDELYTSQDGWNGARMRELLIAPLIVSGIFMGSQIGIVKFAEMQNIYMPALSSNGFMQDLLTVLGTVVPAGAALQGLILSTVLLLGALGGLLAAYQVLRSWWKLAFLIGMSVALPTIGLLSIAYPLSTVVLLSVSTLINVGVMGLAVVLILRRNLAAYLVMSVELAGLSTSVALLFQDDMWMRLNGVILLGGVAGVIYGGGRYGIPFLVQNIDKQESTTSADTQTEE